MNKHSPVPHQTLYDSDYFLWSEHQAALLRQGNLTLFDVENLAEGIESLGKNDRRALMSQVQRLLVHLLKWQFQPDWRSAGWENSIELAREAMSRIVEDSPSLKTQLRLAWTKSTNLRGARSPAKPGCRKRIFRVLAHIHWHKFLTKTSCLNPEHLTLPCPFFKSSRPPMIYLLAHLKARPAAIPNS